MAFAEAPPVAHLDRRPVDELAGRASDAHPLHEVLAHRVDEPAQAARPPVELALADQAREQGQIVVADKAQELALLLDPQPVLGDGQRDHLAVRELSGFFPALPASRRGAWC